MTRDQERRATCMICNGGLKPWRNGWMHVDHSDWKVRPHEPIPKDETA